MDSTRKVVKGTKRIRLRDMVDVQSFIWVLGSDKYDD